MSSSLPQVRLDTKRAISLSERLDVEYSIAQDGDNSHGNSESGVHALLKSLKKLFEADGTALTAVPGSSKPTAFELAQLDLVVVYLQEIHAVDYFQGRAYPDHGSLFHQQPVVYRRFPSDTTTRNTVEWVAPWNDGVVKLLAATAADKRQRHATFRRDWAKKYSRKREEVVKDFCQKYVSKVSDTDRWICTWTASALIAPAAQPASARKDSESPETAVNLENHDAADPSSSDAKNAADVARKHDETPTSVLQLKSKAKPNVVFGSAEEAWRYVNVRLDRCFAPC